MALIDKASLLMVPSVYEDGTLYNVLPSGNKAPDETGNHNGYDQTRADFTFSRGANLAATRVNAAGLIEKGRENLLLQSNSFDTTWINVSTTETSGQEGYDGTNNAWLLTKTAANGRIYQSVSTSGVQTFSVYAKANDSNWISLWTNVGTSYFDLANGTKGSTTASTTIDSEMVSVGNGWYRCSLIFNTSIINVRIYPADGDSDTSGTSGSIYIQDAQLEQSLVATPVIRTTTTTAKAGVLENMPRIDYSSGAGSLKLEPLRTNLITQSEYFGAWTNTNLSIDSDFYNSPEGIANANFAIPTTASGLHKLRVDLSSVTGLYTQSIYAKQGGYKNLLVWDDSTSGGIGVNLDDLSIFRNQNNSGYDVQDVGNGWVRISVTHNYSAQIMRPSLYIYDNSATPAISFAGDGISGIYIYGAQMEAGSYVSSYIPTMGTAASRAADSCSVTGVSDVIGQTEGTLFVEFMTPETNSYFIHSVSDGTNNNKVQIEYNTTSDTLIGIVRVSGVTEVSISATGMTPNTRYKAAIAYKANDFVFYVNGTQKGTDTSGSVPSSMSAIHLGSQVGTFFESGEVYNATLFDTRLTNSELATLTTL